MMINLRTFESFSSDKIYYAAIDHFFSLASFKKLEVDKLENYDNKEVNSWKDKYGITDKSNFIWVTDSADKGPKYNDASADNMKINLPQRGLAETYFEGEDGCIIPESGDSGGYFLFLLKGPDSPEVSAPPEGAYYDNPQIAGA